MIDDLGLPQAKQTFDVKSPTSGFVSGFMCEQIGTANVLLGGGRAKKEDSVDPAVGIIIHKKAGDKVTWEDITPYIRLKNAPRPWCPHGGVYTLGTLAENPRCSVKGHALP